MQLTMNDVVVAKNLRLRCTPNSSRLSENIARAGSAGPRTSSDLAAPPLSRGRLQFLELL